MHRRSSFAFFFMSLAIQPEKRPKNIMSLNQIIETHLLNYDQAELDTLVSAERATYEELAGAIKKDMERKYPSELQALAKDIPLKEYISLIMSAEVIILSAISNNNNH